MVASKTSIPEMGELTVAKRVYCTLTEVDFGGDDLAPPPVSQFLGGNISSKLNQTQRSW